MNIHGRMGEKTQQKKKPVKKVLDIFLYHVTAVGGLGESNVNGVDRRDDKEKFPEQCNLARKSEKLLSGRYRLTCELQNLNENSSVQKW